MLNIIVSPSANNSKAERHTKRIVKYLKSEQVEYSVYFSQSVDELKDNVKQLVSFGENEFVVVGDDSIINSVLSSLKDLNKARIGIIPTSKNDDFARYLKISANPLQAIKDVLLKNVEEVDLMLVNDMLVLNTMTIGASVETFNAYNQYKIKNLISEKYATMKYGNNFGGIELTFNNKTKTKKENIFEMVIANGGYSKKKLVSPLSNMQDGLFNVNYSIVSTKKRKKQYIKMYMKGDHIHDEDTKQFWLRNLKITNPDKKIRAIVDGKLCNFDEIQVSVIEKGLKIYKRP